MAVTHCLFVNMMMERHCYACDGCKKIFSHDFELFEHERISGHRGILTLTIDKD